MSASRPLVPLLIALALAAGCGDDGAAATGSGAGGDATAASTSGSTADSSSGAGGDGGGFVPGANELAYESPPYSVEAGEEVNYWCFTFRMPEDPITVREIETLYGGAIHHLAVFQTLVEEPEGAFDCAELVRDTWIPIFAGGLGDSKITLPEGAGFELQPDQQLLVQLHLLNATGEVVNDSATVVFRTTDDEDVTPAGMFGFDQRNIDIPAHAEGATHGISCTTGREMDVFAIFGHMHQRGTRIEFSRGESPGDEVLFESAWTFEEQPTTPVDFQLAADDQVHLRCFYDNPGDEPLGYGESSNDEMCSMVLYYTPFEELDGCVAF